MKTHSVGTEILISKDNIESIEGAKRKQKKKEREEALFLKVLLFYFIFELELIKAFDYYIRKTR